MKALLIVLLLLGRCGIVKAQDSVQQVHRMNNIKVELSHILYPTSAIFSYERIIKHHQSICISGGYEEFPPLLTVSNTVHVQENLSKNGFKAGAEYRFYLKMENKQYAPHGVYIGPYIAYHYFNNIRNMEVEFDGINEQAELASLFKILNVGFQLGYQFVIKNRLTFDFVLVGPSMSNYNASLKLNGDYNFDKNDVENEVLLKLLDSFPMLDKLLAEKEVDSNGRFDAWSLGWRYQFLIGFQLGKKRK
ncbi:MAG: DUF3575 domain-containing protein [Chitinophagales bacterium]|nr:DUF3575 domain-containing protein [Chitinophagales bacterium]